MQNPYFGQAAKVSHNGSRLKRGRTVRHWFAMCGLRVAGCNAATLHYTRIRDDAMALPYAVRMCRADADTRFMSSGNNPFMAMDAANSTYEACMLRAGWDQNITRETYDGSYQKRVIVHEGDKRTVTTWTMTNVTTTTEPETPRR